MYGKCGEGAYTAWHVHPQFLVIAFAPYSHVAFFWQHFMEFNYSLPIRIPDTTEVVL